MPVSNISKSEFKGTEAKLLANKYNIEPYMIEYEDRSYTVPSSSKTTLKIKKITTKDIKWFIDQMYYYHYGTFKFRERETRFIVKPLCFISSRKTNVVKGLRIQLSLKYIYYHVHAARALDIYQTESPEPP